MNRNKGKKVKSCERHRGKPQHFVTTRQLRGGKLLMRSNPPDISLQPWNHLTLAWMKGPGNTNFGDLVNSIRAQVDPVGTGFAKSPAIQMKVHSIRVWNLTGKTVAMSVFDFTDKDQGNADQLMGSMDTGTPTDLPSLGYELPINLRNHVVRNDAQTGALLLFNTSSATSDRLMHYVRMEWKFDGPAKSPSFDTSVLERVYIKASVSAKNSEAIRKSMEASQQLLQKLLDAQPTLIEKVISGVTHIGAEVAPLLTDDTVQQISDLVQATKDLKLLSSFVSLEEEVSE